jgi:hypothetical protein
MSSIVNGFSDEKFQKLLTTYITNFKFSKMTNLEIKVILSPIFTKSQETRAFQKHIQSMLDNGTIKMDSNFKDWHMDNIMLAGGIQDPLNGRIDQKIIIKLFKIYLKNVKGNIPKQ